MLNKNNQAAKKEKNVLKTKQKSVMSFYEALLTALLRMLMLTTLTHKQTKNYGRDYAT